MLICQQHLLTQEEVAPLAIRFFQDDLGYIKQDPDGKISLTNLGIHEEEEEDGEDEEG
jgi:hypothetical protein